MDKDKDDNNGGVLVNLKKVKCQKEAAGRGGKWARIKDTLKWNRSNQLTTNTGW